MDVLHTPIWVYDIQRHHIYWANGSALGLWEASSLAELQSRDFSADMAAAIDLLLQRYLGDFQQDRSYNEWWTLSPKGVKKQVYLRLSGIQLAGRQMMMTEAVIDADTLYQESSLATGDTLACLFDNEGALESGNHHFDMCFGTGITRLAQVFSGDDEAFYTRLSRVGEVVAEGECRTQKGMRWFQYQFRHIQQGARILLTMRDITDRKLEELEHRHLAWHDSLTGLLNRYGLMKSLEAYCGLGGRFALVFMDLDNFKLVNDNYGHKAGDRLLERVAGRLKQICPRDVELARLGGDEFTALVPLSQASERAQEVADLMLSQMSKPLQLSGVPEVTIGGSIGIAIYPDDADDGDNLITRADMAMYQAKQMGRLRWQRFTPSMQQSLHRKLTLKQFLAKAVGRGELSLRYQPQVDVAQGKLIGLEALLRWYNPVLGHVSPAEFIPLAEEMGLIREIGSWVLATALAQMGEWQRQWQVRVPVSVNLSGFQLSASLPGQVAQQLRESGVEAGLLTLELTETVLMLDMKGCIEILDALSEQGIKIAIDDFGTGYSSLAYLNRLPIDTIKLDRSFVVGLNLPVIRATVAMATSLGLGILAEGVEDEHELAALRAQGCHVFQGFLFSPPMTPEEVAAAGFGIRCKLGHYPLIGG
ncbi:MULTISPECIES: bifunctional diguanylate cyclase/phosphodiesterase [Aeromonas]|uniref:putative bifunctional diguanylate cyclase/phosphodiesterase n=1 Tax=Aeromonas TaxID=642 RepID=UPI0013D59B85|nr:MULTISPECIES: EAL domain-containing protein [Aeromonas]MCE9945946.1 EAL domain-containing protein [Aeromonas rivipollensis]MCE9954652.1 EAL domain-containing protein [Aeromonas rivipollensis]NEX83809.1 EAL domain-containing protein [Aeromonas rivipollensis]